MSKRKREDDFSEALAFVERTHAPDLAWIRSRMSLVELFDDFYEEYCYVVLASGFRARTAARLLPQVLGAEGKYHVMITRFKNERKCRSMCEMYSRRDDWTTLRASLTSVDSLERLPYIGPTTKYHLARNIGLSSSHAKPDVHLVRYVCGGGDDDDDKDAPARVQEFVAKLAQHHNEAVGVIDFVLWIWLSHARGNKRHECCGGGYRLR